MSGYPWYPFDDKNKVISETSQLDWDGLHSSKFTYNSRRIIRPQDELGTDLCNKVRLPVLGKKHVPASVLRSQEEEWKPGIKLISANNMKSSIFCKPESLPKINRDKLKTLNPHLVIRQSNREKKTQEPGFYFGSSVKSVSPFKGSQSSGVYNSSTVQQKKLSAWAQNLEAISKQTGIYSSSAKFKKMIYENSKDIFQDDHQNKMVSTRQVNQARSPRESSNTLNDSNSRLL